MIASPFFFLFPESFSICIPFFTYLCGTKKDKFIKSIDMLTIKQITENTEAVLRGLEKKHFKNAKEAIEQVIALNDKRRSTQNLLDKNLAEVNSLSRTIGQLMKEGKKEEAEAARARVAQLKEGNKELDATMTQAANDMLNVLYTIPNVPYDSVPEGTAPKTT